MAYVGRPKGSCSSVRRKLTPWTSLFQPREMPRNVKISKALDRSFTILCIRSGKHTYYDNADAHHSKVHVVNGHTAMNYSLFHSFAFLTYQSPVTVITPTLMIRMTVREGIIEPCRRSWLNLYL